MQICNVSNWRTKNKNKERDETYFTLYLPQLMLIIYYFDYWNEKEKDWTRVLYSICVKSCIIFLQRTNDENKGKNEKILCFAISFNRHWRSIYSTTRTRRSRKNSMELWEYISVKRYEISNRKMNQKHKERNTTTFLVAIHSTTPVHNKRQIQRNYNLLL